MNIEVGLWTGLFVYLKLFQVGVANEISWWWILIPLFIEWSTDIVTAWRLRD